MNVFGIVGNLLLLGAFGSAIAAVFAGGEARGALIITAISLAIPGFILRGVGARLGRLVGIKPDFIENGTRGVGTVTGIGETGVTINNDPVFAFDLQLEVPGSPPTVSLKQRMPRFLMGAVLPGAQVDVVADLEDPTNVAIDWTVAPRGGGFAATQAVPGPGMEQISEHVGEAVAGVSSAADLLRRGRRGEATVVSARDAGDASELGVVADSDPRRDDRIYVFELDVKLPGRSPYRARVGHRVPERLFGRVGPGMTVEVAVDRDDDQDVAIDWEKVE